MTNFAGLIFISLTIQWTFVSNGMSMLDIFHHVFKFITYTQHKKAQAKEEFPLPYVDDYPFDHGYYQSFAIVCFSMGLLFSGVMPPISFFLTIFFFFKYYIDKYNLVLVYNREFESGGIIVKKQVLPLLFLSLYLFQTMNMMYFSFKDPGFRQGGLVYITIQTIVILVLKTYIEEKIREDKQRLMLIETDRQEVSEEVAAGSKTGQDKQKPVKRVLAPYGFGNERAESEAALIPKTGEYE